MPAVIPVYVDRLPLTAGECGKPVQDDLSSTWLDVFSEELTRRFAHNSAMTSQLGDAAQERLRAPIQGVRLAAFAVQRRSQESWAETAGAMRELSRKLAAWEDRIWLELKRLAAIEDEEALDADDDEQ